MPAELKTKIVMDDRQRADLDSARFVLSVLTAYPALVDADDKLKELKEFLKLNIPKVDAAGGVQLAGRGGAQAFKDNLKLDGTELGKKWLTSLKTVDAVADMDLPGLLKTTPSAYGNLPDNEWYQFNLKLIPKCTQYLAQVTKYGRTAGEIDDLTAKATAFEKAMTMPEEVTNQLSDAKAVVDGVIDDINKTCLATDRFAKAYEDVNAEFVKGFFDARKKKGK